MTMQTNEATLPRELTGHLTEAALGYQRMLEQNPCNPKALVGMSLVALASRQSAAAVKMAEAAVAAAPQMAAAWVALGQALKAAQPQRRSRACLRAGHSARQHERAGPHGSGRADAGLGPSRRRNPRVRTRRSAATRR